MKKSQSRPFFSIVIPTYNRAGDLKCAITAIFQQNFQNFEVIVSDNNSKDETQRVMSEVTDPRIRYFRNERNIGWIANLQRAIDYTKGTYILLHGDDDFILHEDFLQRLFKVLQKKNMGFVRVNYLCYSNDQNIIFDFHNRQFTKQMLPRRSDSQRILEFIDSVDPFFMTGITIKGDTLRKVALIQSEFAPWLPAIYDAIKNDSGMLWPEYEFVATWSKNADYPRYYLANGKYRFECYFEEVKKHVSEDYYKQFLDKRLNILIREFPSAKFFTSNTNFVHYALHLLDLNPAFRFSVVYWFWIAISLLTPKKILNSIRRQLVKNSQDKTIPDLDFIHEKIALFSKLRNE